MERIPAFYGVVAEGSHFRPFRHYMDGACNIFQVMLQASEYVWISPSFKAKKRILIYLIALLTHL